MRAPIFPLPNVVFFPHTFLPLRIFEPRYRRMVADSLDGDRLIAMVLAREERPPGRRPAVHPLGSLGRIEVADGRPDSGYKLVLAGLARVSLGSLVERPGRYYVADLTVLGDALPDLQDPVVADRKAELLLTARRYRERVLGGGQADDLLNDLLPYPMLVNRAASLLRAGVDEKQALLGLADLAERAQRVERAMLAQIESQAAVERYQPHRPEDPRRN